MTKFYRIGIKSRRHCGNDMIEYGIYELIFLKIISLG